MQDAKQEWIVVEGFNIIYRGESCGDAVDIANGEAAQSRTLFQSSNVARVLRDMLPKTS